MRDILTVAKKELRACFSDKVIVLQMILLPFALVFGYAILMSVMMEADAGAVDHEIKAYSIHAPEAFEESLAQMDITAAPDDNLENYIRQVKEKELDLLVVFPEYFTFAEQGADALSDIEVYYNSDKDGSVELYSEVSAMLAAMQPRIFTVNSSPDKGYDLYDSSAYFGKFLGNFIPMMVFMAVFMVCMNLSANAVAGDKENGFLNTLLITPIKRSSIAAGKSVSIFVIAVIASISAFAGMALSLPRLASVMGMEESLAYQESDYISLLLGVVTAAFVLAVVLLIVSTLSKDVKQATNIAPAFLFIMIIPMLLGSTERFSASIEEIGIINYLIPVWNSAKLLKDVIELSYSVPSLVLTCIMNLIVAVAGIFVIGRLFEQEKIINQ
jgi:ABC-type Na+ efflux pump permease subunit